MARGDNPVYVWAPLGSSDSPPGRVQVESCVDCAALVPVARLDRHGQWHADGAGR
jgi:hypothetical protein